MVLRWSHLILEFSLPRLICTLTYTIPNSIQGEPIVLERFFRFQVKKPLDVKTKLYNAEVYHVLSTNHCCPWAMFNMQQKHFVSCRMMKFSWRLRFKT